MVNLSFKVSEINHIFNGLIEYVEILRRNGMDYIAFEVVELIKKMYNAKKDGHVRLFLVKEGVLKARGKK